MTTYEERPIDVWIELGETTDVCDLGHEHPVRYFARKRLGPVVGSRVYDNGYEKRATALRQDRQGRTYHQHIQIDFYSNVSWQRDEDGRRFYARPQFHGKDVVSKDVLDRIIP